MSAATNWFIFGFVVGGIPAWTAGTDGNIFVNIFAGLFFATPTLIKNHRNKNKEVVTHAM